MSILHDTKVTICEIDAIDNAALTGSVIDMKGWYGVAFIAVAEEGEDADFTVKAQQGAVSNMSDAADLTGTSVTFSTTAAGAHGLTTLQVLEPQERYVRAVLTAPDLTAAKAAAIVAIQFGPGTQPQSNDGEQHIGPAEGTA